MSAIAEKEKIYTIEEYLQLESRSLEKLEFDNGKIIEMSGADPVHNMHLWADTISEGLDSQILLKSIDCTLRLGKIYRGVDFE